MAGKHFELLWGHLVLVPAVNFQLSFSIASVIAVRALEGLFSCVRPNVADAIVSTGKSLEAEGTRSVVGHHKSNLESLNGGMKSVYFEQYVRVLKIPLYGRKKSLSNGTM